MKLSKNKAAMCANYSFKFARIETNVTFYKRYTFLNNTAVLHLHMEVQTTALPCFRRYSYKGNPMTTTVNESV